MKELCRIIQENANDSKRSRLRYWRILGSIYIFVLVAHLSGAENFGDGLRFSPNRLIGLDITNANIETHPINGEALESADILGGEDYFSTAAQLQVWTGSEIVPAPMEEGEKGTSDGGAKCTLFVDLTDPEAGETISFPQTFRWDGSYYDPPCPSLLWLIMDANKDNLAYFDVGNTSGIVISEEVWASIQNVVGVESVYFWTVGYAYNGTLYTLDDLRWFYVENCEIELNSPSSGAEIVLPETFSWNEDGACPSSLVWFITADEAGNGFAYESVSNSSFQLTESFWEILSNYIGHCHEYYWGIGREVGEGSVEPLSSLRAFSINATGIAELSISQEELSFSCNSQKKQSKTQLYENRWNFLDALDTSKKQESTLTLASEIGENQTLDVIVGLSIPKEVLAGADYSSKNGLAALHEEVLPLQESMQKKYTSKAVSLRRNYGLFPIVAASVTAEGIEELSKDPLVSYIEEDKRVDLLTAQGTQAMNAITPRMEYGGQGVAIAIVDSGVDYTHEALGGGAFPNNKVIGGYNIAEDDVDPMPDPDSAHGTCCAGIAAGNIASTGDYIGGVAPESKIYALDVFPAEGGASNSDILAAWEWCLEHKDDDSENPLLAISNSIGGGYDEYPYNYPAYATAIAALSSAGITLLAASGNEGFCSALSSPASIPGIISVGAVFDANGEEPYINCFDPRTCLENNVSGYSCTISGWVLHSAPWEYLRVTPYSNSANFLDLLAPSNNASTSDIVGATGYATGDYYETFSGTSAACPYAAGAAAVLQSAAKNILERFLSPEEVREILTTTGQPIQDSKSAITTPFIDLQAAVDSLATWDSNKVSFSISNTGTAPLLVNNIEFDPPVTGVTLLSTTSFSLYPGDTKSLRVEVDCDAFEESKQLEIRIHSNVPDHNVMSIPLSVQKEIFHPADTNKDWRLEISELTAYAGAWNTDASWATPPYLIPESYVDKAQVIWKQSEAYVYQSGVEAPECWTPSSY